MKLPCGACGKYTPGETYKLSMGCFYCWSAKHGKYGNGFWEDADKIPEPVAAAAVVREPIQRTFESPSPYKRDHVFTFSPSVPVDPPNQTVPPALAPAARVVRDKPCTHLGADQEEILCPTCRGTVRIKVLACAVHGCCTIGKKLDDIACCTGCKEYQP